MPMRMWFRALERGQGRASTQPVCLCVRGDDCFDFVV